ncbi:MULTISPECIES: hypothetical protein [Moorena]|nr:MULTISPECIES: hypothetical protein [Moorena]
MLDRTLGQDRRDRISIPHPKLPLIPDSRFPNYSDIDAVANSGNHSS